MESQEKILEDICRNIVRGHIDAQSQYPSEFRGKPGVKELVRKALEANIEAFRILEEGLISGMDIVGEKFSTGIYFVPDLLVSAQAMKSGVEILKPLLMGNKVKAAGTIILGTVKGDMHDIGKNLVGLILEGGGFEVIDLGTDTPAETFVKKARDYPDAAVGMSALLTTTMENMRVVVEALRSRGLRNRVIVGGAAVSQRFADEIDADAYCRDASLAVPLVKKLLAAGKSGPK